ncbi:MAG TPA: OmpA family protein, partial [Saprospiraceae bacterium]|nr:OmpA family protein [Saprospiraceae bacterium]
TTLLIGTANYGLYELSFTDKPQALSANLLIKSSPSCADKSDGIVEAFIKGGTPPYRTSWVNHEEKGLRFTNAPQGALTFEVTDANGQTTVKTIKIQAPPAPKIEIIKSIRPNKDQDNGSIEINNLEQHTYLWSNGQQGTKIDQLSKGKYKVSVTDTKKCTTIKIFDLDEVEENIFTRSQEDSILQTASKPTIDTKLFVKGKIVILDQVKFLADSIDVTSESLPTLHELYLLLQTNSKLKIEIGGHTNTIPPHAYCDQLSTARAKNIAEYFYQRGIDQSRITYKGYGKRRPLTNSTTEEGKLLNQRVEISVLED